MGGRRADTDLLGAYIDELADQLTRVYLDAVGLLR